MKRILLFLCAVLLVAGCEHANDTVEKTVPNRGFSFRGEIGTLTGVYFGTESGAATDPVWDDGSEIGLFAAESAGNSAHNKRYVMSGSSLQPAAGQSVELPAGIASVYDFRAYHPYADGADDATNIVCTIPARQTMTDGVNDFKGFLWADASNVLDPDEDIAMSFRALCTYFTFSFKGEGTISQITMEPAVEGEMEGFAAGNYTCDLTSRNVSLNYADGGSKRVSVDLGAGIAFSKTDPTRITFVTMPFAIPAGGMKLTFTVVGDEPYETIIWDDLDAAQRTLPAAGNTGIYYALDEINSSTPTFSLTDGLYADIPAAGAQYNIGFTSNQAWSTVVSNAEMLSLTPESGNRNGNVDITVSAHTGAYARQGTVVFNPLGGLSPVTLTFRQLSAVSGQQKNVFTSNVPIPAQVPAQYYWKQGYDQDGDRTKDFDCMKIGEVGNNGTVTLTGLPMTGTCKLSFYGVAWNDNTNGSTLTVTVNNAGTVDLASSKTFTLIANSCATGNAPYPFSPADTDYFEMTLSGITSETTITLTSGGAGNDKRTYVFGVNMFTVD